MKEINGQTFDDITPEDSTETGEDDYEEDDSTETGEDDYEEDDEYDDEDSNCIGFGLEYMPAIQGTVRSPCKTLSYNRDLDSFQICFTMEFYKEIIGK